MNEYLQANYMFSYPHLYINPKAFETPKFKNVNSCWHCFYSFYLFMSKLYAKADNLVSMILRRDLE